MIDRMTFFDTLAGALVGALVGAAAAWGFALDLRRRERQDRARDHAAEMRREWAALAKLFRAHQRACDALPRRRLPFRRGRSWQLRHIKRTKAALLDRLIDAAGMARGDDSRLVTSLGRASQAHLSPGPVRTRALNVAAASLVHLATCEDHDISAVRAAAQSDIEEAIDAVARRR